MLRLPTPHQILRGETYYDWNKKSMTERYLDKCIDIFPDGRDYPCQFLSVQDVTYLIRFKPEPKKEFASCCRWSDEAFWAPRPDVISNMKFEKELVMAGSKIDFWLLDIPLPGPFGYGFVAGSSQPASFWFPVISGWVQQNFADYTSQLADPSVFAVPPPCHASLLCGQDE